MTNSRTTILTSKIDDAINLVRHLDDQGNIVETRIAQRQSDEMIIYMSTSTGCANSCRFCHLTQTNQTSDIPLTVGQFAQQMDWVVSQLRNDIRINRLEVININFMARGDGLSNPNFIMEFDKISAMIVNKINRSLKLDCVVRFKISTIFPKNMILSVENGGVNHWVKYAVHNDFFKRVEIYYSLYSLTEKFRKRWLPKAIDPEIVGKIFSGCREEKNGTLFRLHHALIKGENDSIQDAHDIVDWLERHDIRCPINLVMYNPFNSSCGEESDRDTIDQYVDVLKSSNRIIGVKEIERLAPDVFAACGMFVTG